MTKQLHAKQTHTPITQALLDVRAERCMNAGFGKQKWIQFCEELLAEGFDLYLYEARETYSKYITVKHRNNTPFKVRFSNHKPIKRREKNGDCDFFVGITNFGYSTTDMALAAVREHFSLSASTKIISKSDTYGIDDLLEKDPEVKRIMNEILEESGLEIRM